MATIKEITVQELNDWKESGKDFQLIDVREQHEFDEVNMEGKLIPLGTVLDNADQFSKDKPVVVHCRSGKRSANAINALQQQHGFDNLYNLEGGILAWIDVYGV
ncbi:MAG: rhodanese-like domain-containing protein [Bacteroidota bacterium]